MRVYPTLQLAASEIERDIYKSAKMQVSRVQQWDGLDLLAHENIGYTYAISPGGIPASAKELVQLGVELEMEPFLVSPLTMEKWLRSEINIRLDPTGYGHFTPVEEMHPALQKVYEGKHPSYTYRERMVGMVDTICEILEKNPDSRRAYWAIFQPQDSHRAIAPTRVPCSLGYQFLIRTMPDGEQGLYMIYDQRSSDFENFWLSDVWFANQAQRVIADILNVQPAVFIHFIHSFHSFNVGEQEIY